MLTEIAAVLPHSGIRSQADVTRKDQSRHPPPHLNRSVFIHHGQQRAEIKRIRWRLDEMAGEGGVSWPSR